MVNTPRGPAEQRRPPLNPPPRRPRIARPAGVDPDELAAAINALAPIPRPMYNPRGHGLSSADTSGRVSVRRSSNASDADSERTQTQVHGSGSGSRRSRQSYQGSFEPDDIYADSRHGSHHSNSSNGSGDSRQAKRGRGRGRGRGRSGASYPMLPTKNTRKPKRG